ncbi:MAG: aminoacyl-tRNA hydrolase [Ignavibacteriota bacterium]
MFIFAGLGNPGKEYDGTRHNIGFVVVDALEAQMQRSSSWKAGKGEYYYAKGVLGTHDIVLVKPITYMNLSGRAVRDVIQFFKCDIGELVVICDDIALPLGQLRLRPNGSDGGHNGLSSVIYELGTDEYARLRFGVGSNFHKGDQARYVLSKFTPSESELVGETIISAVQGCLEIIKNGTAKAMNAVNLKPKKMDDQ